MNKEQRNEFMENVAWLRKTVKELEELIGMYETHVNEDIRRIIKDKIDIRMNWLKERIIRLTCIVDFELLAEIDRYDEKLQKDIQQISEELDSFRNELN